MSEIYSISVSLLLQKNHGFVVTQHPVPKSRLKQTENPQGPSMILHGFKGNIQPKYSGQFLRMNLAAFSATTINPITFSSTATLGWQETPGQCGKNIKIRSNSCHDETIRTQI